MNQIEVEHMMEQARKVPALEARIKELEGREKEAYLARWEACKLLDDEYFWLTPEREKDVRPEEDYKEWSDGRTKSL